MSTISLHDKIAYFNYYHFQTKYVLTYINAYISLSRTGSIAGFFYVDVS